MSFENDFKDVLWYFQNMVKKKCEPKNVNKHPLMDIIRHIDTVLVSTDCKETESIKKIWNLGKIFLWILPTPRGGATYPQISAQGELRKNRLDDAK